MKKILSILLILLLLTGCTPAAEELSTPAPTPSADTGTDMGSGETLTVHFIDVGQADCILLECAEQYMLIDGGNKADGSLVVSYLEQQGVEELSAVICTHAHEDHVGGLPSVLAVYPTAQVYAPTKTYSSNIFDDFMYYVDQQGLEVIIPQPGDQMDLALASVTFLGPTQSYADPNNTSIVVKVEFGETSFLFTGDMETTAENDMLDYWGESYDWSADVLKVGHHGSDTSTSYRFLNAVMPTHAVISVGAGNSYGHPCEVPLSRLNDAGCIIYRTDELGHIIAVSDGQTITFTWGNQNAEPDNAEPGETTGSNTTGSEPIGQCYIGNVNSKKFHSPGCASLPAEKNRVYFDTYDEAIEAGYTPCKNCLG